MLDSGAYSIMSATLGGGAMHVIRTMDDYFNYFFKTGDWDRYLQEYIAYIKRHRHIIDLYVELDLQMVVGEKKVWEWRDEFRAEGLKPIIVWHNEDEDTTRELIRLTGRFGIPRLFGGKGKNKFLTAEEIKLLIDLAEEEKAKWIHGFGYGVINDPQTYQQVMRMTSIDATTAVSQSAFAKILVFESGRLKSYKIRELRDFSIIRNADPKLYDFIGLGRDLYYVKRGKVLHILIPIWNAMQIQKYYNRPSHSL